jgi:hypothetical protein
VENDDDDMEEEMASRPRLRGSSKADKRHGSSKKGNAKRVKTVKEELNEKWSMVKDSKDNQKYSCVVELKRKSYSCLQNFPSS